MSDTNNIHNFAIKWLNKFKNSKINYIELVEDDMSDDCAVLGFNIDCEHIFIEKYGNDISSYEVLNNIIDDVKDIHLLGSVIYSRWCYLSQKGSEILDINNRAWFILALSRLALLSGDNPFIFEGTLKKMRIVSNNIGYDIIPKPNEEVEQHITINDKGQVWFSAYNYGYCGDINEKSRSKYFKIDKEASNKLLNAIATYFRNEYTEIFATDIGSWTMELTNTEGVTYNFSGSLCNCFEYDGINLSDLIRNTVGMYDLYVFDGKYKTDVINKIILDYNRITKIKINKDLKDLDYKVVTWYYSEHLIIDRATETLEHIQNIGKGCKVSHKYEVEEGVKNILDSFDEENLFANIQGNPDDVIETPNESKQYTITLEYNKKPNRIITGSYDKNGLPEDFSDFAKTIFDFTKFYGFGEMLDSSIYNKVRRRKSDYIFCSVIFNEGYKSYYYLTDDDNIEIGDFVIVPVGKDNHNDIVEVVNIEYFSKDNAPLPIEKTKKIICKITDYDFDNQ